MQQISWYTHHLDPPIQDQRVSPSTAESVGGGELQSGLSHRLPWPNRVALLKVGFPAQRQFPPSEWLMPGYKDLPPASWGEVMVNFMCSTRQLWVGWSESWLNIISECICEGDSVQENSICTVDEESLPYAGRHHPTSPLKVGIKQKMEEGRVLSLCLIVNVGHQSFPALGPGLMPSVFLVLRPSWSRITPMTLPGLPACMWQIIGCLSFHKHMSQFFFIYIFSLSLSYLLIGDGIDWSIYPFIYLSSISLGSVSLGNTD